ncbi:hypothetical protein [Streptomyces sp. NPDC001743]
MSSFSSLVHRWGSSDLRHNAYAGGLARKPCRPWQWGPCAPSSYAALSWP